jgi:hypothetical protein
MALADGVVYVPIVDAAAQFSSTGVVSDDTNTGIGEMDALDANTGSGPGRRLVGSSVP